MILAKTAVQTERTRWIKKLQRQNLLFQLRQQFARFKAQQREQQHLLIVWRCQNALFFYFHSFLGFTFLHVTLKSEFSRAIDCILSLSGNYIENLRWLAKLQRCRLTTTARSPSSGSHPQISFDVRRILFLGRGSFEHAILFRTPGTLFLLAGTALICVSASCSRIRNILLGYFCICSFLLALLFLHLKQQDLVLRPGKACVLGARARSSLQTLSVSSLLPSVFMLKRLLLVLANAGCFFRSLSVQIVQLNYSFLDFLRVHSKNATPTRQQPRRKRKMHSSGPGKSGHRNTPADQPKTPIQFEAMRDPFTCKFHPASEKSSSRLAFRPDGPTRLQHKFSD